MIYADITSDELVLIEYYYKINTAVRVTAKSLKYSRKTIYKTTRAFICRVTALKYHKNYK